MASKTSIIIKSVDENNKSTSRSITDVSKTATNAQLKAFAQALNATSTNTYTSSSRVQTTDLDGESEKLDRTITVVRGSDTLTGDPIVVQYSSIIGDDSSDYDDMFEVAWTGSTIPASAVSYKFSWEPESGEFTPPDITFNGDAHPTGDLGTGISFNLGKAESTLGAGNSFTIYVEIPGDSTYNDAEVAISIVGGNS